MKDFPSGVRTKYLSGDVTPSVRVTLRRLTLDFGPTLYHNNDEHVIDGVHTQADDYQDPVDGNRVLWGDSCIASVSPYARFRLIAPICAGGADSSGLWFSRSTTASDDWSLAALSATGTGPGTMKGHTRIGVYPGGGTADTTEIFYVWYFDTSGNLYRITLTHTLAGNTWAWSDKTTAYDVPAFSGAAIHPVSASNAILVAYEDPYLYVKSCTWTGAAWAEGATIKHAVHMSDNLIWSDAHWSDAVVSPADSNKIVVGLNLSRWGSAHTVTLNKVSGLWSQPREVLPSTEQWGNLKVLISGMTVVNGRIWAVTVREPVASGEVKMAHHVALASSKDGVNWRDESYVTTSTLRGKLLYQPEELYCYVVGNASVARAGATIKLGTDIENGKDWQGNSVLHKYQLDEIHSLSISNSGAGSVPELTIQAVNEEGALSGSGLLEPGVELLVEIGA